MTRQELKQKGIARPDVILVTGDAYIDSSFSGTAIIGRVLEAAGYRVAVISQPDINSRDDICSLGQPGLFWGITSGCVDSEVANYTALGKPRRHCDFTPGGANSRRPDRACIAYSNLIRRYFKNTVPLVLGGIEASLRRTAHYDQRTDSIRRSILLDAKADILVYGMGETQCLQIASRLKSGRDLPGIPGTCTMQANAPEGYVHLPDYEQVRADRQDCARMFRIFYENSQSPAGQGLIQKYCSRFLVHHPPPPLPGRLELDRIYELPYTGEVHPFCAAKGRVRALETIADSITTHRGCYGECSFCSIAVHQGRSVVSRSMEGIVREAALLASRPDFKGTIQDVGGATANMYGSGCFRLVRGKPCQDRHCIGFQGVCPGLKPGHAGQMRLLQRIQALPGIKRVQVSSGIRYDLILEDKRNGLAYLEQILKNHVSGRMKTAPEHLEDRVLKLMNKPPAAWFERFLKLCSQTARKTGTRFFLSCYAVAAHPGCTLEDMQLMKDRLAGLPHPPALQVQVFTPAPCTRSTMMYWSGVDPLTGRQVWSEKKVKARQKQKQILIREKGPRNPVLKKKLKKKKIIRNSSAI